MTIVYSLELYKSYIIHNNAIQTIKYLILLLSQVNKENQVTFLVLDHIRSLQYPDLHLARVARSFMVRSFHELLIG